MATNEKRRQKKLARKKANRKAVVSAKKKKASLEKMLSGVKAVAVAKNSPVEECIVRADLFPDGIGTAVVSRRMPNGFPRRGRLPAGCVLPGDEKHLFHRSFGK